jgi:glycosyltransferase involved in cell wall biosynthesis
MRSPDALQLASFDLAKDVQPIPIASGYTGARVLVHCGERALAIVTVGAEHGSVSPEALERALLSQVGPQRLMIDRLLRAPAPEPSVPLPPISVVVCTRDRADSLRRCLAALARLEYPSFEVVVVDNASRDATTREAAAGAGVRCVREDRPGLDWARNCGLRAASHELIAYTDDDVEVEPGWLRGIATAFADPSVSAVTGLVLPGVLDTEAELIFELYYGGMGNGVVPRRFEPRVLTTRELLAAHSCGVGASMAFRRAHLLALGGFDTALDVGTPTRGGGDLDIFHRTLASGAVLVYTPAARVRHHHRSELAALRRQHRDNGRGFGCYLIAVLRRGDIPRLATAAFALSWLRWLVGRIVARFRQRERVAAPLWLAELLGAAQAPWATFAARRSDRSLRRSR